MQKLASLNGLRVSTGALQIDADWPGLFLRGDEVSAYAAAIERILQGVVASAARALSAEAGAELDQLMQDSSKLNELARLLRTPTPIIRHW